MLSRTPPTSDEELVRIFDHLFEQTEPETAEEVDAVLREAGYDPDELAARIDQVAQAALARRRLESATGDL